MKKIRAGRLPWAGVVFALLLLVSFAAAALSAEPFVYVHFSDTHVGTAEDYENDKEARYAKLCQALDEIGANISPSLAIVTGDLTSLNDDASYALYRDWVARADFPIYSLPGNHDRSRGEENYERQLGPDGFAVAAGPCYFVGFDSWTLLGDRSAEQLFSELEERLSRGAASGRILIAAAHYPLLVPERVADNSEREDFQVTGEKAWRLTGLFLKYGVDLYHCGHTHATYDAVDPLSGTTHLMGPAGYHYGNYRVIVLDGDNIGWAVNSAGEWPLVAVTAPARRLPGSSIGYNSTTEARAMVFPADGDYRLEFRIDDGELAEMRAEGGGLYRAEFDAGGLKRGRHSLTVTARSGNGAERNEEIEFLAR